MLEGRSDSEVARELGCDPATVWRWRHDPGFAQELHQAQRERLAVLNDKIAAMVPRALDTIADLMNDDKQAPMLRLRAAETILDRAAWTGGAQERRIQEGVRQALEGFIACLAERMPAEHFESLQAAAEEPWPEAPKPKKRSPRITIRYPEDDE